MIDPINPHLRNNYGPWKAYGQSKLANCHFGIGIQQRFVDAGVRAASLMAHPGLANNNLQAVFVAETGGGMSQKFFLVQPDASPFADQLHDDSAENPLLLEAARPGHGRTTAPASRSRLPVAQVSLLGLLSPAMAATLGWSVLGQSPSAGQLAGMILILTAVWIGQTPRTELLLSDPMTNTGPATNIENPIAKPATYARLTPGEQS